MKPIKSTITIVMAGVLFLSGCSKEAAETNSPTLSEATQKPALSNENGASNPNGLSTNTSKIKIVQRASDLGPGPITKETSSMGGIHIGDSPDQVKALLGEPTSTRTRLGEEPQKFSGFTKAKTRIFIFTNHQKMDPLGVLNKY